jgi:hypothetical protein
MAEQADIPIDFTCVPRGAHYSPYAMFNIGENFCLFSRWLSCIAFNTLYSSKFGAAE